MRSHSDSPAGAAAVPSRHDGTVRRAHRAARRPVHSPPVSSAALDLLDAARRGIADAALASVPADRFAIAHVAALRAAAAVLASRTRPDSRRRRLRSAWVMVSEVAPDLGEWAAYFAAGAAKRAAAEAGLGHVVTAREADDLLRASETFLTIVEDVLGVPAQRPPAPASARLAPCS